MATIKSYSDLQQSKKLAEILPLESADCYWEDEMSVEFGHGWHLQHFPCWSLTALLNILPNGTNLVKEEADTENEKYMCTVGIKDDIISTFGKNPVDTCYEMILKLNKLKML